ncbi:short-chain dehydrogenase [Endozoicomonas sp. OPT23]|uniref:SDR family oxidoreductase n=1 Tax=Endozoicomonas sp. OPT23 TaxID=2072845 RepID=UPI00129A1A6B|nr:SDR family oxidoreductase [Endozoicomonas sp. OPT23]MRI31748.1 short-chain dehydrogenase [Endozoicomonas sp. OPT23]
MGTYAITGGSSGIGAVIKSRLENDGHSVINVDIQKTADIVADLATSAGREAAIQGIKSWAVDGFDGFIPCAGVGPNTQPYSRIAQTNFFGVVRLVESLLDLVAKKQGSVLFISSNSAPMPTDARTVELMLEDNEQATSEHIDKLADGFNAYSGSKQAVAQWMRRKTQESAQRGVRFNAIAPGFTRTPMTEEGLNSKEHGAATREFVASIPTGRPGEPEDMSNAAAFLLSSQASFICGSVLFVDGGHDAMLRSDSF